MPRQLQGGAPRRNQLTVNIIGDGRRSAHGVSLERTFTRLSGAREAFELVAQAISSPSVLVKQILVCASSQNRGDMAHLDATIVGSRFGPENDAVTCANGLSSRSLSIRDLVAMSPR